MRILKKILISILVISMFCCTACDKPQTPSNPSVVTDPTTADYVVDIWNVFQISFKSTKNYTEENSQPQQFYVIMDVEFTNRDTGTKLTIPTYWNGGNIFGVRFAPTETGVWDAKTICATDDSLNDITFTVGAKEYAGELDIYKHGFVKTESGKKHFVYNDGTPFFYLGDTHWSMLSEEFDSAGDRAGDIQTDSHFKYIVDKRVEQGFTVYQSQPLGASFDLSDGKVNEKDIKGLREADKYFQYIAEKGMVHANSQFFFTTSLTRSLAKKTEYLEALTRHWVARYGAYPVMWTLAQECDNDCYYGREGGLNKQFSYEDNPWVKVAEYIHKYDAYKHPLTGHQESTASTTVTGQGCTADYANNSGMSLFLSPDVTEKTGHNWYGAQWSPDLTDGAVKNAAVAEDYWKSSKVSIGYESRYDYLWTGHKGARITAWYHMLNGFAGVAYGAIDIWSYKSTYSTEGNTQDSLGEIITVEDKMTYWGESIKFETGDQMGYMRKFFETFDWQTLVPDFNKQEYISYFSGSNVPYMCAHTGNDIYVAYFYDSHKDSASFVKMDPDATYTLKFFNPLTGEFVKTVENITGSVRYKIGELPDNGEWVVLMTKNK